MPRILRNHKLVKLTLTYNVVLQSIKSHKPATPTVQSTVLHSTKLQYVPSDVLMNESVYIVWMLTKYCTNVYSYSRHQSVV